VVVAVSVSVVPVVSAVSAVPVVYVVPLVGSADEPELTCEVENAEAPPVPESSPVEPVVAAEEVVVAVSSDEPSGAALQAISAEIAQTSGLEVRRIVDRVGSIGGA